MSELRQIAVGILVILLVLLTVLQTTAPPLPKRFTVRWLLIVTTVLAILIGAVVAFYDEIVWALR